MLNLKACFTEEEEEEEEEMGACRQEFPWKDPCLGTFSLSADPSEIHCWGRTGPVHVLRLDINVS